MTKKLIIVFVILTLLVVALPATSAQDGAAESVCLVTDLGRVNDGTFNQFAFEGMSRAAEEFELDSDFIETSAQTDYEANIDTCVSEGFDIVVTVGFLIADATLAAAEANPDVYFVGVDQFVFEGPENYVGIQFREDQAGFLVGVLAGLVTESNIVAGVYGIDIPPVIKFRVGYEQGVGLVSAISGVEIETLGVYIDNFVAPDRGASAATQFIGDGADVIFGAGGPTGSGGITQAASEGVWVIGVDQDEWVTTFGEGETPGSEFVISSALKRVDVGVFDMIAALAGDNMDGFPGGGNYVLDVNNGGITIAEAHEADLPAETYAVVSAVEAMLADGSLSTGVSLETFEVETPIADIVAELDGMLDLSGDMDDDMDEDVDPEATEEADS